MESDISQERIGEFLVKIGAMTPEFPLSGQEKTIDFVLAHP
ncbi:MAG: hypothetical protein PF508_02960 [Spirochaeta sp.]|jgi:hypothetical protein|nr:hypothetical protein [Spirochaeta sp.]